MRLAAAVLIFMAIGNAWPQAHGAGESPAKGGESPSPKPQVNIAVPLTEAVITMPGLCEPGQAAESAACVTVITQEQFENLQAGLSEAGQALRKDQAKAFAQAYAEFLAYSAAARKAGMEDDPRLREFIRYQQLRIMAGLYKRSLEEKYKSPSAEDIAAYYQQHARDFEEIGLQRLLIPKNNPGAKDQEEYKKKALEIAQAMQERAAKGEDLEDLQKEIYQTLGITISPPATQIGKRRRASLVPEEADEIFSLRPGDAGKVEIENSSYVIYKVESKRTLPLEQVKEEVSKLVSKEKLDNAMKAVTADAHPELNPKYFPGPNPLVSAGAPETHAAAPQSK
jgi:hypothetical protein